MGSTSFIIGFLTGAAIAAVILYLHSKTKTVSKLEFDKLSEIHNEKITNLRVFESKIQTLQDTNNSLSTKTAQKETETTQLQTKAAALEEKLNNRESNRSDLAEKLTAELATNKNLQDEINLHKQKISELTANNSALNDKLTSQKAEVEELQKMAQLQFEKIANRLFEEKSEKFTAANKTNIEMLLTPLKEDINKFKEKVETTHTEETKQRTSLEERIKGLIEQTNKVSTEANNLATALKGKAKKRGNWGEMILERILEASGLTKEREYFVQPSIKTDDGKTQRPDVTVHLPDSRVIIIDSKVSLIAYDNYSASEDNEEQKIFSRTHQCHQTYIDQLSESSTTTWRRRWISP